MLKNTLFVILLMISSLFTACAEGYVSDVQKEDDTKEIRFSLNMEGGLTMSSTRASVSLDGMKWKYSVLTINIIICLTKQEV